ncbi:hypothetical protein [Pseudomonas aegrilactucae]|uniref:Uncharacterized protein n=1 Tax=Pseudomonas aegrilactucae TaxID=2854028 RepID=A0A9Q3ADR0_9PSED|nr:hypothetical protein [Pseudomonas aegrilactucae]MBV6287238.1 hypothetical protein [Pseudomonas aegrilactucae]
MTPETFIHFFAHNSRGHELLKQNSEHALNAAKQHELQLEQQIIKRLRAIASLHLVHSPALEQNAQAALQGRQQAISTLQQELDVSQQGIARLLETKAAHQQRLDSLAAQINQTLAQDPERARLALDLEQAVAANQEAASGYLEIRQECADKLPAFEQNRVYRYLRERHFATPQYRAFMLGRLLDGWLARQVDYAGNRANELHLQNMHTFNEAAQAERTARLDTLAEQAQASLTQARSQPGIQHLEAEIQRLQAERASLEQQVLATKRQANAIQQQLAEFTLNQDPYYQRACGWVTDMLKSKTIDQLLEDAKNTPDPADDELARELQGLYPQLTAATQRLADATQAHARTEARYQQAKTLERALREDLNHFKYSDHIDYQALINAFMDGTSTLEEVRRYIRNFAEPARAESSADGITLMDGVSVLLNVASVIITVGAEVSSASRSSGQSSSGRKKSGSSSSNRNSSSSSGSGSGSRSSSGSAGGFSTSGKSGGGGFRTTDSF